MQKRAINHVKTYKAGILKCSCGNTWTGQRWVRLGGCAERWVEA